MRWRPDCPKKSEVVRHQRSGRNELVSSYLLWFRLHASGTLVFGLIDCVLCWCLVRTASPLTFCGLQVPWYLLLWVLPWSWGSLLQDCPAFGVHTKTVTDFSLRVHSVYFSEYFIAGSLHLRRLQPARSRSLALTRILYQQGPEALPLPGFSPLFIIVKLRISSFQLPGRLHHPAVADHSSGHIFLLFLVICFVNKFIFLVVFSSYPFLLGFFSY